MAQEVGGHRNLLGDLAGMSILFNGSLGENRCVPIFFPFFLINAAQKVISWDVIFEIERVKQPFLSTR